VIVGGGVAALTAALFAGRAGCSTTVLVAAIPGGQLATIDRVEDFPGFADGIAGYVLGPTIQEQAASAGADFVASEALALAPHGDGWSVITGEGEIDASAVIIATG